MAAGRSFRNPVALQGCGTHLYDLERERPERDFSGIINIEKWHLSGIGMSGFGTKPPILQAAK